MNIFNWLIGFILLVLMSTPIIAESKALWAVNSIQELLAWGIALFTFLSVVVRAIADLTAFLAERLEGKTEGKWGKISQISAKASWWIAKVLGWFGAGVPKKIAEKKAGEKG